MEIILGSDELKPLLPLGTDGIWSQKVVSTVILAREEMKKTEPLNPIEGHDGRWLIHITTPNLKKLSRRFEFAD